MTIIVPDLPTGDNSELSILRKQTVQYIQANPTDVTFARGIREPDGAGGFRTTREYLDFAQTVRIIQSEERGDLVERRNSDGEVVRPELNLLAEWDANVQVGDVFYWSANKLCEVVYITDMKYELLCEVAVRS